MGRLHTVVRTAEGSYPSSLTYFYGVLYGTTGTGGTHPCNGRGCGTIFKITSAGTVKILHSFGGGNDGNGGDVLNGVNGVLYGTTFNHSNPNGIVYKITTSAVKSNVYRFQGGTDGTLPIGFLTQVNDMLYGTTESGGSADFGTVYSLSL
jgi:uncharacterized repeat protein (TIGR03803 family)